MTPGDPPQLDSTTRVQQSSRQVHCQVGDLAVVMDIEDGDYFELNRVGTRIWGELETPTSIETLVERLMPAFDVDRPTCERDVLAWVRKMEGLGFIEIAGD